MSLLKASVLDPMEPRGGLTGNELGTKTQHWVDALVPMFGTPDRVPPSVMDKMTYTDPGTNEFFPSPNPTVQKYIQSNLKTSYDPEVYWQARHSPITPTNSIENKTHFVTVEPSTMDRAATQSTASYLQVRSEEHLTSLKEYISGYEMDGMALAHEQDGPQLWDIYVAGITDAQITTMCVAVETAILKKDWYWLRRREMMGVSTPNVSVQDAIRQDNANFGIYSKRLRWLYEGINEANKIARSVGTAYDTLVLPENSADRMAFEEVGQSGALVGSAVVAARLHQAGASYANDFKGHKIMSYLPYCLPGQPPISLSTSITQTGRFWVASPCKYKNEGANYDAVRAAKSFYMNVGDQRWTSYDPDAVDDASVYFEHDDQDGAVSSNVEAFADALPRYLADRGIVLDPNDASRAIMPHLWWDEDKQRHRVVTQHGQQNLRFCELGFSRSHGKIAVAQAVRAGELDDTGRRQVNEALALLDEFYRPEAVRMAGLQGWFAAVALKNAPENAREGSLGGGAYGGAALPDYRQAVDGTYYLGVGGAAGAPFQYVARNAQGRYGLVDALGGDAAGVTAPAKPYGFATPPAAFALADYYQSNSQALGAYAPWQDYFVRVSALRAPLQRFWRFMMPVYPYNPSMDPSNVPLYYANASNDDAETRSFITFVVNNIDRDRTPLLVAVQSDDAGSVTSIGKGAGGAAASRVPDNLSEADFLAHFGLDANAVPARYRLNAAAAAEGSIDFKTRLQALFTYGFIRGEFERDLVRAFAGNPEASRTVLDTWQRYDSESRAYKSYYSSLTSGGAVTPALAEEQASRSGVIRQYASLDYALDPRVNSDEAASAGAFLSKFYAALKSYNASARSWSRIQFQALAQPDGDFSRATLTDESQIKYLATSLAIDLSSFRNADLDAYVVRPSDPEASSRLAAIDTREALEEAAKNAASRSALRSRYGEKAHIKGLNAGAGGASARVNDEPNQYSVMRHIDNQNEHDPFVRAAANLFDESPFTRGQRRRFRDANFLSPTNYVFAQYDGTFEMNCDLHFKRYCGKLLTMMSHVFLDMDRQRFRFSTRFSTWFECDPGMTQDTLVIPNMHFAHYNGGYDQRGIYSLEDVRAAASARGVYTSKDTFVYEVGTVENEDTLPPSLSATGVYLSRDVMGTFDGTNENKLRQPWLLYHDFLFRFSGRNTRTPETYGGFAEYRDTPRRNTIASMCAFRTWVARSVHFKCSVTAVDALGPNVAPGQLHIFNGSEGMMEADRDLLTAC